jgi:hypothetical protein
MMKRLKEDGFWLFGFSFVWVLFCDGSFLFNTFIKFRKFFITTNLIIIYRLSTIKGFYYNEKDFSTILIFLGFCHNLREITKEEIYIYIYIYMYIFIYIMRCMCEHVNI